MSKKLQKDRTSQLTDLIEMKAPKWLTKEVYREYTNKKNQLRNDFKMGNAMTVLFPIHNSSPSPTWGSYVTEESPQLLVEMYNKGAIISDPSVGQDPKKYSPSNLITAAYHAGRHWGWGVKLDDSGTIIPKTTSMWIANGTFNIVKFQNGKLVLQPCNVEHRLWALVGFPLDIVPLKSEYPLYYYNDELPAEWDTEYKQTVRRIKVNDMYLSDIVIACSELGVHVTQDEVLRTQFYSNKFKFELLPFFTQTQCEQYFREVNSSSSKTIPQLLHAESQPFMWWAKQFSSIKLTNFGPLESKLHPLFELLKDTKLVSLESMMYTMLVASFIDNGYKFVDSTDDKLAKIFYHTNGFHDKFTKDEEFKTSIIDNLDFLYSVFSQEDNPSISRQSIQQLLHLNVILNESGYVIADRKLFIENFTKWYVESQNAPNGDITNFGVCVRAGSAKAASDASKEVRKNFIHQLSDDESLKKIGIVLQSPSVPRLFDADTIMDSFNKNNGMDIDGSELITKPVGGHIISDMELIRMTISERDEAFLLERINSQYEHKLNCRAMSSYHNLRMGILRLSEYKSVIGLDDSELNKIKKDRYNELKKKPILV
jgi:hypothetical protein